MASAIASNDDHAIVTTAPAAAARLRADGDHHLAGFIDMSAVSGLLSLGRFDEVDQHAGRLVEHFVEHGPPTMLN